MRPAAPVSLHLPTLAEGAPKYMKAELDRITDRLGTKDIKTVTQNDVQKIIDGAITRGPSAQRTTWKVARAFFAWAAGRARIDSPCTDIGEPSKDSERKRFLKDDEIRIVWKAAEAAGDAPGALVKLLLLTGCRRDEIAYLRRAEVKAEKLEFPASRTNHAPCAARPASGADRIP